MPRPYANPLWTGSCVTCTNSASGSDAEAGTGTGAAAGAIFGSVSGSAAGTGAGAGLVLQEHLHHASGVAGLPGLIAGESAATKEGEDNNNDAQRSAHPTIVTSRDSCGGAAWGDLGGGRVGKGGRRGVGGHS
ncbi:hypothetical protein TruAng_001906 [Truncatella angustata]|nr:hypothetical protein TruAng_001906 [Truncatella angustata]